MQSKISKYTVNYFNEEEFHYLKSEIFTNDCYYFESDNPNPLIIDVGAYVGISVLYFKHIYPNSRIVAFEPNPEAAKLLRENVFINELEDIEIHESAITDSDGEKDIYIDNTGMDRYSVASFKKDAWNGEVKSKKLRVKTAEIGKYLKQEVDLLKLDVEGSEQAILNGIRRYLPNIKNMILEYHPTENQNLKKIIDMLKKKYDIEILYEGKTLKRNIPENKLLTIKATYRG